VSTVQIKLCNPFRVGLFLDFCTQGGAALALGYDI